MHQHKVALKEMKTRKSREDDGFVDQAYPWNQGMLVTDWRSGPVFILEDCQFENHTPGLVFL